MSTRDSGGGTILYQREGSAICSLIGSVLLFPTVSRIRIQGPAKVFLLMDSESPRVSNAINCSKNFWARVD